MKNKERFMKEIVEVAIQGHHFAFDKYSKRIVACNSIRCDNCLFNGFSSCNQKILEWANSEYKEKKVFSEADKAYVRAMDKLNWFAKEKSGAVWGFQNKPFKQDEIWCAHISGKDLIQTEKVYSYFTSATFESLSWDDEEPTHRDEILGYKEKDGV